MHKFTPIIAMLMIAWSSAGCSPATSGSPETDPPPEEASPGPDVARIENGGFEQPDIGSYEFFSERIPGWTVTRDRIEILDASYGHGFRVRSGSQLVILPGMGAISQNVPTGPDSTYRLVFHLYREPDAAGPSTLTVRAGSVQEEYEISPEQSGYRREVLRFEGAGATRITFTSTTGDTEYGPIIDDVSVEAANR